MSSETIVPRKAVSRLRRLWPETVFGKLALAFMAVAAAVAVFAAIALSIHDETVEHAAYLEARHSATAIASAIVAGGQLVDDTQGYIDRLHRLGSRELGVVDVHGIDLADSDHPEIGMPYKGDDGEVARTIADGVPRTFVEPRPDGTTATQIVVPIRHDGATGPILAALLLEINPIRNVLYLEERGRFYRIMAIGASVVVIVTLFGLGIARRITQPIRELRQGVERIQQRDYTVRVALDTRDEFGGLGRAFNAMARDLEVSRAEVAEHQNELEERVAIRTQELNTLNAILQEQVEQRSWEATHDVLTGLMNRREFERLVERSLTIGRDHGRRYVVAYMDLDRFKVVNDTCGHVAGDEMLKQVSAHLKTRVRGTDTLARLGGDEFGLLLEGCAVDQAQRVAADILALVDEFRFHRDGKVFTIGVSIGLCEASPDTLGSEAIAMADAACYWAKEQGRHRACVYRSGDKDLLARRGEVGWIARLSQALDEDRFVLYHQTYLPLADQDGAREHLEVLLRMIDEEGNVVQPGSFLPAAERYNLMPAIDRWVLTRVFEQYERIVAERNGRPVTCAINLSGASINAAGFLDFIRDLAMKHPLPPRAICFEITETVAIHNLRHAGEFVRECKALGFLFALDDFGTGTSSFGYLKTLPIDFLKIDGSFVKNMVSDQVDRAMTETINRIGHIMGITTIAEYAEDQTIIDELRAIGVDYAQGYGVCRPRPLMQADVGPATGRLLLAA